MNSELPPIDDSNSFRSLAVFVLIFSAMITILLIGVATPILWFMGVPMSGPIKGHFPLWKIIIVIAITGHAAAYISRRLHSRYLSKQKHA